MKHLLVAISFAALVAGTAGCNRADLKSDKGRYSYVIGYQVGTNIKKDLIDLDNSSFNRGLIDAMEGKKSQLNENDMRDAFMKMSEGINKKKVALAQDNLKKAEKFLEANKGKSGVKTTPSGLQYKMLTEGTGPAPAKTSTVVVHYRGKLIDGTEFDSSYKRNTPAEFKLEGMIPGFTEALQLMKKGGKAEFFIPPALGYGDRGNQAIPGNSVLVFEIELIDVK